MNAASSSLPPAVGFAMLTGRLALRQGAKVVLGAFVLFGAPVIAASVMEFGESDTSVAIVEVEQPAAVTPREELPPSTYKPYAGASLRRASGE